MNAENPPDLCVSFTEVKPVPLGRQLDSDIYVSPHPDVKIPDSTVFDYVFGSIEESGLDRTALLDGKTGESLTYRTLITQIEALAGALADQGVEPGDVIALHASNSPMFAVVLHGILRVGATATPINVFYTAEDVTKQLCGARARWLFTTSALYPTASVAARLAGIPSERIFVIGTVAGHVNVDDLVAKQKPAPTVNLDPTQCVAVLPFSSGTTGKPKGVCLTHRNLVANTAQTITQYGLVKTDVVLGLLPFFHVYGLTVLLNVALLARAHVVTIERFDLRGFLETCDRHKLTYLFVAPPVAVLLAKHPSVEDYNLTSVRAVMSGAAPLDGDLGRRVAERLDARVLQGYGMSELSPTSHVIPFNRPDIAPDSVGLPIPNTENKLLDVDTGHAIPIPMHGRSAPGELLVRGPNVMVGYLNDPGATAETIDRDGFLHTGDIAFYNADGSVFIVDRLKELIKYKGYQVPPAELEAVLLSHPEIVDAAVVGAIDNQGEEVPKAFVVRQPGGIVDESEIINFVAERYHHTRKYDWFNSSRPYRSRHQGKLCGANSDRFRPTLHSFSSFQHSMKIHRNVYSVEVTVRDETADLMTSGTVTDVRVFLST